MEEVYDCLTRRARLLLRNNKSRRVLVALAGPPGSGKSTIAARVVRCLDNALVLPMDGFHFTRARLGAMPNSEEAFARRGVHWTYDALGVVGLIEALHETSVIHTAPCFDHEQKDPIQNAILIPPDISLVIIEGNWLLYDEEPWSRISKIVDDTWFVDVDRNLALERIAKRHIRCGIETSWEEAVKRATDNDAVNGDLVRIKLIEPSVCVQSIEVLAPGTGPTSKP